MSLEVLGPTQEEEQRFRLLTGDSFPAESLGRECVRRLEGRERKMAVVLQGVERLFAPHSNQKLISEVVSSGFPRIYDLLCLTPQELEVRVWGNKIKGALNELFDKLKITQDQHLLEAIFGKNYVPQSPLTPKKEKELHEAVGGAINTLRPGLAERLAFRFGINDGVSHTLEETGRHFGVGRERIHQVEVRCLQLLRHPSRSGKLSKYLTLDPNSVAYSLVGLTEILEGDLKPLTGVPLSELQPGIGGLVRYVEEKSGVSWLDLASLLRSDADLFSDNLSDKQIEDLKGEILSVYEKTQAGSYLMPQEPLPLREYTNRLLPELRLGRRLFQMIVDRPIDEIFPPKSYLDIMTRNALVRNNINTIGQLLNLSDLELFQMERIGRASLAHLKSRLREYIEKASRKS